MKITLKSIFEAIDLAHHENDIKTHAIPKIREYFSAKRSGVFFFEQLALEDSNLSKILEIGLSVEHNPVVRYLVERHSPVHEALVTSPKAWKLICPRPDHWHVMAGPIVNRGKLIGVVGCTRDKLMPAFNSQNLSDFSAICLHLSVGMATVKSQHQTNKTALLTPRELQIAELVALGKTNAEIGHELWITTNSVKQALKRMFRKLEVSSRAEMVARLFTT